MRRLATLDQRGRFWPLEPASLAVVLGSDLLLYALQLARGLEALSLGAIAVAATCGALVAAIEALAPRADVLGISVKALVAALAVALPLPLAGGLLAVASWLSLTRAAK